MSWWWDHADTPDRPKQPPATPMAERNPITFVDDSDDDERWTQVSEIDPRTGQWMTPPAPDWERRATGWLPLSEFLRDR